MEWIQVFTIVISTVGLISSIIFWMWREIRSDMKEFRQDVKDFHGRLCRLEEKYLKMDRRK